MIGVAHSSAFMPGAQNPTRVEQRLLRALQAGGIAAWEWDLSTDHVVWSDNAGELLGLHSGHTSEFEERVHPQDQGRHQAAFKATVETGEPYDIEIRFKKSDGTVIWIQDKAELQTSLEGERVLIGITADITARKKAEMEAQEKTELLEATLENMDQGLLLIDADQKIALYNRRVTELLDLPGDLLAARPDFEDLRHYQAQRGEFPYIPDPSMARLLRDGPAAGSLTHERVRPDGTALEIRTVPLAGGGAVRTFTDITARKQSETEAFEAAALLRVTLENMDQGLIMFDASDTIQVFNNRAAELLGLPAEFLAERPSFREVTQLQQSIDDFAKSDEAFQSWVAGGRHREYRDLYERERPNGTVLEIRTVPLAGGGAVRTYADITARRKAEAALWVSEERARDFANIASDLFWETDADFRYTSVMGMAKVLLSNDAMGKTLWDAAGADPSAIEWRPLTRALAARRSFRDFELELKTPRGGQVWLSTSGHPIHDEAGIFIGYRGVSTSITHRKTAEAERERLQEQLHRSQRLQTVGQLTGGIAHDFNNLLTVILGNAEMLVEDSTDAALTYSLARHIMEAAERGADLTQKLLAFGGRHSLKPERLSLKGAVEDMTPMLQRTLGKHIELVTDLQESELVALTDRTLLESAILNLAINARDAMPQRGTLTIRTGGRAAGPNEGVLPMGQPVVYLTISDTGTGMSPEVLSRVFEPFYTTKEVGKGSGLGLSMVYGFTQQTGGHVSIESRERVGTSVTLVLPAIATIEMQVHERDMTPELVAPIERILLVEDEPAVLSFVSTRLLSLGYEVKAVSTAPDALDLLARDQDFSLLFSDIVLPKGMSGVELVRRARELKPDLKVLLTSGYSEEVFAQHGRPDEGTLLLRKPYKRRELAETLRKVLE
jgi:PAS domain S-box-containing protein